MTLTGIVILFYSNLKLLLTARGGGGTGGGSVGEEERLKAIENNTAYVEGRWVLFQHKGAMRLVTRKASLAGIDIPASPVDPKCKSCPAFLIKGMCNTGCGNMTYHVVYTREQDLPLWGWAVRVMREISAPSAPVT